MSEWAGLLAVEAGPDSGARSLVSGGSCSVSDWLSAETQRNREEEEPGVLNMRLRVAAVDRVINRRGAWSGPVPALSCEPSSPSFFTMAPLRRSVRCVTPCLRSRWRSQLDLVEKKASQRGHGNGFWPEGDGETLQLAAWFPAALL